MVSFDWGGFWATLAAAFVFWAIGVVHKKIRRVRDDDGEVMNGVYDITKLHPGFGPKVKIYSIYSAKQLRAMVGLRPYKVWWVLSAIFFLIAIFVGLLLLVSY